MLCLNHTEGRGQSPCSKGLRLFRSQDHPQNTKDTEMTMETEEKPVLDIGLWAIAWVLTSKDIHPILQKLPLSKAP